jgi:hypothetical protein
MNSLGLALWFNAIIVPFAPAEGFGARLDHFCTHHGGCSSRVGTSVGVFESNRNKKQLSRDESISKTILDFFDFPPASYENLDDFLVAFSDGVTDGTFSHLQEKADSLAHETFAESSFIAEFGDEECLIPEEWKSLPTMMESIDVMEFLGIARVQPLRVCSSFSHDPKR